MNNTREETQEEFDARYKLWEEEQEKKKAEAAARKAAKEAKKAEVARRKALSPLERKKERLAELQKEIRELENDKDSGEG